MSLSLIGIIFIQAYYLTDSFKNEKQRFTFTVKRGLSYVAKKIEEEEYRDYVYKFRSLLAKGMVVDIDTSSMINFYMKKNDSVDKQSYVYSSDILEKNMKLTTSLFGSHVDTISLKRVLTDRESNIYNYTSLNGVENLDAMLSQVGKISNSDEVLFQTTYLDISSKIPVEERITEKEINRLLQLRLIEDDITIGYEFAIYKNGKPTAIQTANFNDDESTTYSVPIYYNENDENSYRLLVDFPESKKQVRSSILSMLFLSVLFTVVIIITYLSALYQLLRQRKISQIKSDFINNMTHEFKTPIATISLALDSIKNPKVITNEEKIRQYLKMIGEENKRMHSHVENVLRISKLEKNELAIPKEDLNLHDIVLDAVMHLQLIVESRSGVIDTKLNAEYAQVLANDTHLTNVFVNIIDNAIKYSPKTPEIKITTYNTDNAEVVVKIQDRGMGMSKSVQKRVFEKFYREHTGNIHNVKGHGLGLAYVKQIIDDHFGTIKVESEQGKGSVFIITLPLSI